MKNDLLSLDKKRPDRPTQWWKRADWSVLLRVPGAIAAGGALVAIAYAAISGVFGYQFTLPGIVAVSALAVVVVLCAVVPPRRIFWFFVGPPIRRRYAHLDTAKARRNFPHYPALFDQLPLLEITLPELCEACRIRCIVGRYFRAHPSCIPRPELLECFCDAVLVPLAFLAGDTDYGDDYTERRLYRLWDKKLAYGWTRREIDDADEETRREILTLIELQRREDLSLPQPGGGHE